MLLYPFQMFIGFGMFTCSPLNLINPIWKVQYSGGQYITGSSSISLLLSILDFCLDNWSINNYNSQPTFLYLGLKIGWYCARKEKRQKSCGRKCSPKKNFGHLRNINTLTRILTAMKMMIIVPNPPQSRTIYFQLALGKNYSTIRYISEAFIYKQLYTMCVWMITWYVDYYLSLRRYHFHTTRMRHFWKNQSLDTSSFYTWNQYIVINS